jgi:hypothetical protein
MAKHTYVKEITALWWSISTTTSPPSGGKIWPSIRAVTETNRSVRPRHVGLKLSRKSSDGRFEWTWH